MTAPIREATTQAAEWLVRLRCADSPASVQPEFADWLRESPVHIEEYLRAIEVWEGLADPRVDSEVDIATLIEQSSTEKVTPVDSRFAAPRFERQSRSRPIVTRLAAGLAIVAVLSAAVYGVLSRQPLRLHTDLGESRVVVLKDHSVVDLNTQTDVLVTLSGEERHIELLRGEAMFEVSKDPRRPFIVYSGGVIARAVGTKFSVSRVTDGAVVTVAEGRVVVATARTVSPTAPGMKQIVEVTAGEQATAATRGIVTARVSVEKALAWRDGKLVFDDERLSDVIGQFNRYNLTRLVIADPTIAERRVSGVFRTHDPESLAAFLVEGEHLAMTRGPAGEIVLGPAQ